MGRIRINAGDLSGVEAATGFSDYTGPCPPKGVYRCVTKMWKAVTNKSDNPMFKIIFEVHEPADSPKARYNGYAIWHNANLTEQGAPYINAMVDALSIPRKGVWNMPIVTAADDDEKVVKIGGVKVLGIEVGVNTKRREYKGEWNLNAVSFLPLSEVQDVEDDEDEDDIEDSDLDEDDDENDDESF